MVITYQGENYFKIQAGDIAALIDPSNQRSFKGASFILRTDKPSSEPQAPNEPLTLTHQGEYEVGGVHVSAWTENGTTVYKILMDDMSVVILGRLTKEPNLETQEHIQDADILITPAGQKPYLSAQNSAKLIRQLEPSLVIPAFFDNLKPFLKEMDQEKCEPEEKITIKKKDLKPQAMLIRCLKP